MSASAPTSKVTLAGAGEPRACATGDYGPDGYGIVVEDGAAFSTRTLCHFRHSFSTHPLLSLDRLQVLGSSLYETAQCRFNPLGTTDSSPFNPLKKAPDGRSISDVFRGIEEPGSWIALYNIETDPTYNRFLWDVMRVFAPLLAKHEKVFDIRGFIFVSAPPSTTPFHIDRENNFWMQIRGRKKLSVWRHTDRSVVPARQVEDFIVTRSLKNVALTDAIRSRSLDFDCGPGDGVFFPSTTPHMTHSDTGWTRPGDCVAISIGINFYTNLTRRNAYVHNFNRIVRKFGFNPRFPGEVDWLDRLRYPFGRAAFEFQRRFRGLRAPPGF